MLLKYKFVSNGEPVVVKAISSRVAMQIAKNRGYEDPKRNNRLSIK